MSFYRLTLIVEGPDLQSATAIRALFDAGCDDALVGRADGIQYVDFDRTVLTRRLPSCRLSQMSNPCPMSR